MFHGLHSGTELLLTFYSLPRADVEGERTGERAVELRIPLTGDLAR